MRGYIDASTKCGPKVILTYNEGKNSDCGKWRLYPVDGRHSIAYMAKKTERIRQPRWAYLLIGILIGFAGTLTAVAIALID